MVEQRCRARACWGAGEARASSVEAAICPVFSAASRKVVPGRLRADSCGLTELI